MSRTIELFTLTVASHGDLESTHIEAEIRYNDGSMGSRRGYYLSVSPVEIKGIWRTYTGFSGKRMFVEEAKRYSAKTHASVAAAVMDFKSDVQRVVGSVCLEHKLQIIDNQTGIQFVSHQPEEAAA